MKPPLRSSLPDPSPLRPAAAVEEPPRSLTLSVFDEVLRGLAHGAEAKDALRLLADKARLLTHAESAAIGLLNPDRETLTFVAAAPGEGDAGAAPADLLLAQPDLADAFVGKTARTGEPYLAYRPSLGSVEAPAAVTSAAVVPIFDEGRTVGALAALNRAEGEPFGGDDVMALTTLAAAASIALRNARLEGDAQRQRRELSLLYDAVRSVSGNLSAQDVLRTVVEQAATLLENTAVVIFLANDERTHLYIAEDSGLDADRREVTLSAEAGLGAAVLGTSLPVFLGFAEEEDEDAGRQGFARRNGRRDADGTLWIESPFPQPPGARAAAFVPRSGLAAAIRSGDAVHGLILVLSGQPVSGYTDADANLLSALASQAAVAIENSWLYEDATRRAEEATALYELSQAVTSTLRLPQVLDRVAKSVLTLLGVDKFALFLHDPRSDRLQMVVERGLPPGAAERVRPAVGQGIPGWVMEFETPTAVMDVAADHRNAVCPLHPEGVVSMTCMPLQVGPSVIGVLCALSSRRRLFTVSEMELLYTIANQAAIAIENARVYADVRHKSLELRKSFHRVARALGSSRAPDAVPRLIASLTQELTGADYCALYSLSAADGSAPAPRLVLAGSVGFRLSLPPDGADLAGETPTAWVARKGRSLALADIDADERFRAHAPRPARGRVAGYLGAPLRTGDGDVVGVLEVYTRSPRDWRADEVRLLLTFASQATVAFQNASLVEAGRRAARRADALAQLMAMAESPSPSDPAAALAALRDAAGIAGGIVVLQQTENGRRVLAFDGISEGDAARLCARAAAGERDAAHTVVTSVDKRTYVYLEGGVIDGDAAAAIVRTAMRILSQMP